MGVVVSLRPTGAEPQGMPPVEVLSRRRQSARAPARPGLSRPGSAGLGSAGLGSARPGSAGAARKPQAPLRLTTRGRVVLGLLALLLVVLPLVLGARAAQAGAPATAPQVERHVVVPGETLWQIASTVAEPGDDLRDVVAELVRLNRLPDSSLLAGQTIVVPVSD